MNKKLLSIGETADIIGVSVDTLRRWDKSGRFSAFRVSPTGNRYYRRQDVELFVKNPVALVTHWVSNSNPFEPDDKHYCQTRDVFQARLEHFRDELVETVDGDFSSLVTAIAGEIGNNSFDHNLGNWPDILGVYFSYSLTEKRIVLADRGLGVLSTLKRVRPELANHIEALRVAFTETISSRAPESRGNGLKFVRNVVASHPINLSFQTGDAILIMKKENSDIDINIADEPIRGCLVIIRFNNI
jgi:hypothetical protein